jgi:hypothetical protein
MVSFSSAAVFEMLLVLRYDSSRTSFEIPLSSKNSFVSQPWKANAASFFLSR